MLTGDDAQQSALTAEAERGERANPVPSARSGEQRKAALDAARSGMPS
jgi:hypothetical protein